MDVKSSNQDPSPAFLQTVEEIMKLYRSLPARPSIEEVEAAMSVIETVNGEEQVKLEEISKQVCPQDVPEELFSVLQQVRKNMVLFQSHEQRKEALHLVEADKMFEILAGLIQRASTLVSKDTRKAEIVAFDDPVEKFERKSAITEQSLINRKEDGELEEKDGFKGSVKSSSTKAAFFSGEGEPEKLSLMKVATIIEDSAKTKAVVLNLKGRLMDRIEWLPLSIGKLSFLTELDISENRIMVLPSTITGLKALTKFDIHSNQLINLPDSFGELINLSDLDLHANRLRSLPSSFGNLKKLINLDLSSNRYIHFPETIGELTSLKILKAEINELEEIPYTIGNLTNLIDLDLSSNQLTHLPETIGELNSLKILNAKTNELEEIPYTIGNCLSLVELRLDFNQLRALPEAVGKLGNLEILTMHYNRIRGLPTAIGNLSNLIELDVSFNELESIPENLCFAVSLKKLNVGKNFADLRELPRSIGNLEMLEELDISDDQIRVLPDSFRLLSKLRVFHADETPLEVPPRQVAKLGAEAVIQFMAYLVAKRDVKGQPSKKKKGFWHRICLLFWSFKRNSQ